MATHDSKSSKRVKRALGKRKHSEIETICASSVVFSLPTDLIGCVILFMDDQTLMEMRLCGRAFLTECNRAAARRLHKLLLAVPAPVRQHRDFKLPSPLSVLEILVPAAEQFFWFVQWKRRFNGLMTMWQAQQVCGPHVLRQRISFLLSVCRLAENFLPCV